MHGTRTAVKQGAPCAGAPQWWTIARQPWRTEGFRMRRSFVAAFAAILVASMPSFAQEAWPQRQVTVIVPFAAGGSTDLIARILAQHMQAKFATPFVVENRAGAGGSIGTGYV